VHVVLYAFYFYLYVLPQLLYSTRKERSSGIAGMAVNHNRFLKGDKPSGQIHHQLLKMLALEAQNGSVPFGVHQASPLPVACLFIQRICQNSPQQFTQPLWIEGSEVLGPQYFVSKSKSGASSDTTLSIPLPAAMLPKKVNIAIEGQASGQKQLGTSK
jgi:hypothetical protein